MSTRSATRRQKKQTVAKVPEYVDTGPPLTHLHFQGDRHLHPQRLPSARRETPVSLRLLDINLRTVENVQKIGHSLKRVTATGLKMSAVPSPLLECLTSLEKLNLSCNRLHDAGIPDGLKSMENLVELNLNNNNLARIPVCFKKMKQLVRLDLSHNKLDSLKGLEKLKRLQSLVVEHNVLTTLAKDVSQLKKLESLCCSNNNINDLHSDIKHLRTLRDVDISHNKIASLTPEIFLLPKLEVLNVSNNRITKVPTFNVRVQTRHWIEQIDLSENAISRFPEHLLMIAKKLDLGSNKMKILSGNVIKKLDWKTDQELIVDDNPFTYPPPDICFSGLRSVIQFYQEARADSKVHQGVKVIVIGSYRSGKSSLIQSLIDQQARLEDAEQPSSGIDPYDTGFDYPTEDADVSKTLSLSIWDFSGHPFYLYPQYIFHQHPSITLVTFNMAEFTVESFNDSIGSWFDWMISKANKLVSIVVGTQTDKLSPCEVENVKQDAERAILKYIKTHKNQFEAEIKGIEARPHISSTYSDQLKNYVRLKQARLHVHSKVIVTSSANFDGFRELRETIEQFANEKDLFPNVMRVIPTFWLDVEHFLEDKGNYMLIPVMTWEDYEEMITRKFGMKHLLTAITQYLHETGKVLWFSDVPSLKSHVFLRPAWLFDIFRHVYRHDIENDITFPYEPFKQIGLTNNGFERGRKELLEEGIVARDFMKGMLVTCIPSELNQPYLQILTLLLEGFGIGYPVQKKLKEGAYNLRVEPDSEGKVKITRMLVPWYRKNPKPSSVTENWTSLSQKRKLVAVYRFPRYMPTGLFEILAVRIYNEKCKLHFLSHWGGGIHAQHQSEPVQLLIVYSLTTDNNRMLKFDVRDASKEDVGLAKELWAVLLPLLMEFEDILQTFPGVWVSRSMECPQCGEASFVGEWMSPKETQSLTVRTCENCHQCVDTAFLVQPKERKGDDVKKRLARTSLSARRLNAEKNAQRSCDATVSGAR